MRRAILLTLSMLLLAPSIYANVFVVASYKHEPKNLSARVNPKNDNNDELCGLILVKTSIINLGVVASTGLASSVKYKNGYYWIYLSPGTRRISFYKIGFVRKDYDLPTPVKSGETYILTLKYRNTRNSQAGNTMGFVIIRSNPPGADVYVDDSATGLQTPFQNSYNEGYYRFTLKKPFYDDYSGNFEIIRGKKPQIMANLVPNFGSLKLSFNPSNEVSVSVDGDISTQNSPYFIERLKPGRHTLVLNKATYDSYTQAFTIAKGQTTPLNINMVPDFGGITVTTTPEINAKVNIDGVDYNRTTPLTVKKLSPGTHTLRLTKKMYLPWQRSFTITKGKSTQLAITLKPNFGVVNISAHNGDAIYIDNQLEGTGNYHGPLLKGEHVIKVEHRNYYTQSKQIEVLPGQNLEQNFNLQPETGTLSVMTDPIGADIFVDNKPEGQAPNFIDSLMVGIYTVKLHKKGYATVERQVEIRENQTTAIKEKLLSGMNVRITSQPSGAELYVDGKYQGVTPVTIPLSFEDHKFKLQKENYKDYIKTKELTLGNDHLDFQLEQFFNLKVSCKPKNAIVYIDGIARSNSFRKYSLSHGEHKITVEANNYITHSKTVLVNGKLKTRSIKLRPSYIFGLGYVFGINTKAIDISFTTNRIELALEVGNITQLPDYIHYSSYTTSEGAYELGFRFYYPIDFSIHGGYGVRNFINKGNDTQTNPDQNFYSGIVGITLPIRFGSVAGFYLKSDYWTNTENGGSVLFTAGFMF